MIGIHTNVMDIASIVIMALITTLTLHGIIITILIVVTMLSLIIQDKQDIPAR